jgi:vitamin B12 transporter
MRKVLACLLSLSAGGSVAVAQETRDTVALRELVVSATRMPMQRGAIAASVTVLHGDELRQRGVRTVEEALRGVSGATLVQGGSYGAFASLFFRGGESDYVQVLIDGVQINSPGEHFDFANLSLENIERIEIVRGPGSVLYGSDAVTGVIQLFSRPASARTHVNVAVRGGLGSRVGPTAEGSFGSGSFDADLRGRLRDLNYGVGVSHFRSAGAYAFNNEHANTGVTGHISVAPDAATDVSATFRYGTNTFHYPTDGAGILVDANQHHVADAIAAGVEVGRRFSPRLEARMQLGFNRNDDSYADAPDHAADTLGFYAFYSDERFQRAVADVRVNYALARRTTVTLGGEYESQRERGWNLSESEFGPFGGASRDTRANRAAYVQVLSGVARINLQTGARFEHNQLFGDFVTYRGGISAWVTGGLRARAAAGTGFKAPRFYEQFATGFVKGNPDLEPETSRSVEAGLDLVKSNSRVSATYFAQRFRNLIQYVGQPSPPDAANYLNLARASASGVELEATHTRGQVSVRANYTRLDTEVTNAGTGEDPLFLAGQQLIRRPAHTAGIGLTYSAGGVILAGSAQYVGKRADLDFNNFPAERVRLEPYTRVDVAAELPMPGSDFRGTLKVENALNDAYEEAHNFPARGRVVFLGVKYGR